MSAIEKICEYATSALSSVECDIATTQLVTDRLGNRHVINHANSNAQVCPKCREHFSGRPYQLKINKTITQTWKLRGRYAYPTRQVKYDFVLRVEDVMSSTSDGSFTRWTTDLRQLKRNLRKLLGVRKLDYQFNVKHQTVTFDEYFGT